MSLKELLHNKVVVLDGSMGTQLEALIPKSHPLSVKGSPLWSTKVLLAEPQLVTQIHQSYVDVGCDMLITASYQASLQTLKDHANLDLAGAQNVWGSSVDSAKTAAASVSRKIYIAGSIGPYGAYLANGAEYSGDYQGISESDLTEYHRDMVKYFVERADVDLIAFETIPSLPEIKAILALLDSLFQAGHVKDFYISFSCKNATSLADGTPLSECVQTILDFKNEQVKSHLLAVGCNCVSYEIVPGFIEEVNKTCKAAGAELFNLVVYPNLGFDNDMSDPSQYGFQSSTEHWNKAVQQWLTVPNVRIIGGCCSITPPEIKIISDAVKN